MHHPSLDYLNSKMEDRCQTSTPPRLGNMYSEKLQREEGGGGWGEIIYGCK